MPQRIMCIFWSEIRERLEPTRRHETLHRDILSKHKVAFDFTVFFVIFSFESIFKCSLYRVQLSGDSDFYLISRWTS